MNYKHKQKLMIRYLNIYLSKKDLRMKNVLWNIKKRILNNRQISMKQYLSVIKFIEREREFKNSNREEIYRFFEPLIELKDRKQTNGNTLTEFFV